VRAQLIQTDNCVVAVELELVIPVNDPGQPRFKLETAQLLRDIGSNTVRPRDFVALPV
jgi:hypothetical protein